MDKAKFRCKDCGHEFEEETPFRFLPCPKCNGNAFEVDDRKKVEVMKLTTKDGVIYYNTDHSPELIAAMLKQAIKKGWGWKSIELIEIAEEDYWKIPASNDLVELFKSEGCK